MNHYIIIIEVKKVSAYSYIYILFLLYEAAGNKKKLSNSKYFPLNILRSQYSHLE